MSSPQRRGDQLRTHILGVAKQLFLERGFDGVTMDAVAAEAGTSKRSLYAFSADKEALFAAVLDLIRELYLATLGEPADYGDGVEDSTTVFAGRFLQLMMWDNQVRACRLAVAEATRHPANSTAYYDAVFATTGARLATHLAHLCGWSDAHARAGAERIIARAVLPRFGRVLLGAERSLVRARPPARSRLASDVDLDAIRAIVREALAL